MPGVKFAIRDDDTNYFTQPEEIEEIYKDVWDFCPPTLFLVSDMKGNWKFWVEEIFEKGHRTNWEEWRKDDRTHPIEENQRLIEFLKSKIYQGKIGVGFHGVYHRNEDLSIKKEFSNNYIQGAEFYTDRDLSSFIESPLKRLETLLETNINSFTAPQNLLSQKGYDLITKQGLNLIGGGISMLKKEKSLKGLEMLIRQGFYRICNPGMPFPYMLVFKNHKEIPWYYPLYPDTHLDQLKAYFEKVYQQNGVFVLSTHYHGLHRISKTYNTQLKNVFFDFMDYVAGKSNVECQTIPQLFDEE